jgi:excisionase family DNA binding protein
MFTQKMLATFARELAPALRTIVRDAIAAHAGGVTPRYLSLEQAAKYLSSTPDGVRGMLRAKRFPARKLGNRVMIDVRDIDKAMEENVHWLS